MDQRKGFRFAKAISKKSNHPNYKIGCALLRKGRVVAASPNVNKTHPYIFRNSRGCSLHAEIGALIRSKCKPEEAYVYRELSDGSVANARPCDMCMAALMDAGVKRVYYTITGGYAMERLCIQNTTY